MTWRILTWLMVCAPALCARQWARFDGDGFQVFTDCGGRQARAAARRVEEMRAVFADKAPAIPLRLYLFASSDQFDTFRPDSLASGYYQSGAVRDYIALPCSVPLAEVLGHEYTHYAQSHQSASLPMWLSEGLAEYYATAAVGRDGKVTVGGAVSRHVRLLEQAAWVPVDELLTAGRSSRHYGERSRAGVFYAQSWLLVQYLAADERFAAFVESIRNRAESAAALRATFGKEPSLLMDEAGRAVARFSRIAGAAVTRGQLAAAAIDAVTAELALAELYHASGKENEAAAIHASLARLAKPGAELDTALGAERLAAHDYEGAKRHLEKAMESGASDADTYFEFAMLTRDTGGSDADVRRLLLRVTEANPNHAEAYFVLGRMSKGEQAVAFLRRASELTPRRSAFWQGLAEAHQQLGQADLARRAAEYALDSAETGHEVRMARAAIEAAAEHPAPREKKPDVFVPDSWKAPRGDAVAAGALTDVECVGGAARLRVKTAEGEVTLEVRDPSKVELRGGGEERRVFSCGPQEGARVEIEYVTATKAAVAIRFL